MLRTVSPSSPYEQFISPTRHDMLRSPLSNVEAMDLRQQNSDLKRLVKIQDAALKTTTVASSPVPLAAQAETEVLLREVVEERDEAIERLEETQRKYAEMCVDLDLMREVTKNGTSDVQRELERLGAEVGLLNTEVASLAAKNRVLTNQLGLERSMRQKVVVKLEEKERELSQARGRHGADNDSENEGGLTDAERAIMLKEMEAQVAANDDLAAQLRVLQQNYDREVDGHANTKSALAETERAAAQLRKELSALSKANKSSMTAGMAPTAKNNHLNKYNSSDDEAEAVHDMDLEFHESRLPASNGGTPGSAKSLPRLPSITENKVDASVREEQLREDKEKMERELMAAQFRMKKLEKELAANKDKGKQEKQPASVLAAAAAWKKKVFDKPGGVKESDVDINQIEIVGIERKRSKSLLRTSSSQKLGVLTGNIPKRTPDKSSLGRGSGSPGRLSATPPRTSLDSPMTPKDAKNVLLAKALEAQGSPHGEPNLFELLGGRHSSGSTSSNRGKSPSK